MVGEGGRQWWLVVISLVGVFVVGLAVGVELQCDAECTCEWEKRHEKDYKVRCNATLLEEATVTEQLLPNHNSTLYEVASYRTHVLVEGAESLTLTFSLDFFLRWRLFTSCSLDVIGAGRVIFPTTLPSFVPDTLVGHYFAGVGLAKVTVSEVPLGVFSGKQSAGLRLNNSIVGRLPARLLTGVNSLRYLEILNSTVGVLEGPLGDPDLRSKPWTGAMLKPVLLANSTVGSIRRGAVRLRAGHDQEIALVGLSIGFMDSGAVEVEGAREVVVEKCSGARMEADALVVGKATRLTVTGNSFILQPGALTNFPCDDKDNYIYDNSFTVLQNATASSATLTLQQEEGEDAQRGEWVLMAGILGTAIHPSCVAANLPLLPPLPPSPSTPLYASWQAITPEQVASFGAVGIIIGVVVTCLVAVSFLRCRHRRRNDRHAKPPPTVIMSHIPIDPIYDEPFALQPPPLPATLPRAPSTCTPEKGTCCGSETGTKDAVENLYVTMDTTR